MTDLNTLAQELRTAAAAYYDGTTELMTDAQYDAGIEQLRIAVEQDPTLVGTFDDLLTQVSAGQSTGGDVTHPTQMGSLEKAKGIEAVEAFVASVDGPVVVEPKLDGLAARAVYHLNCLTQVVTRGDGSTGEDITEQVKQLNILPLVITGTRNLGREFEVRGEIFMPDNMFEPANAHRSETGATTFVNQRNAAAGILRKGDTDYSGYLDFAVYDVITTASLATHSDRLFELESSGMFTTARSLAPWLAGGMPVGTGARNEDQWATVERAITTLDERRPDLGFPIDGVVVKADRDQDRARLGSGSRAPKWAIAYKYEAETAVTRVVNITTAVGRTGRLAIRVEVEPVFVGGTTVTFATGHNVSWMLERDIRIGDTVTIKRANDVIPYIEAVDLTQRPAGAAQWEPPATDPNGGEWDKSTLLWRSIDPSLSVGATLRYAASRDALDIEGLGTEIVDALVESGLVTRLPDLFTLTAQDLTNLELSKGRKLGSKNAVKIIAEIDKAKDAPWNRVITALGIRMTGRTMSRRLAAAFPGMDSLLDASVTDLANVDGIGVVKGQVIYDGLKALYSDADDLRGWTESTLATLAAVGVNMGREATDTTQDTSDLPLDGMTVVVSGSVPGYTRTTVAELIDSLGGKASGSVSASTSLLVSEPSTSSKYVKAQNLGVRIVTPDEFLEMIA